MNLSSLASAGTGLVGVGRALTGIYFLTRPSAGAKAWVGDDSVPTRYLARAVGGRDLVIGVGALWAMRNDDSPLPWVVASVVGDVIDTAFGAAMLDAEHRAKTIKLAGGFGVLGAVTAVALAAD